MSDQSARSASEVTAQGAPVGVSDEGLTNLLVEHLPGQRWFSTKGAELSGLELTDRRALPGPADSPTVEQVLVRTAGEDGGTTYQLWIGWAQAVPAKLEHAVIGRAGALVAYDALHDAEFTGRLLGWIADGAQVAGLSMLPEPDADFDRNAVGLVLTAEQSNTSVVYGHSCILKVFRRLSPGPNPDAEILRALHTAGSPHIAAPLGIIGGPVAGQETTLALLTTFVAGSAEGWAMATTSVRDLFAEGDLRADEVGGDFAAESSRLGQAVAAVHADLAAAFGTVTATGEELGQLAKEFTRTAIEIADQVPSLAGLLPEILAVYERMTVPGAGGVRQRIHGDLHLGQSLRVPTGWLLIDFEGEPNKPLAYRRDRHSPLKDIASMLRSFDYAAHHPLAGANPNAQLQFRAAEWAQRNRSAFCDGYAAASGVDPRDTPGLLAAFELDKAVYEVGYEHGHRPDWEPIPLQAVSRLVGDGGN